ncbi:sialate O-acetylesterase [Flammeovirga kamogawensis]|uniref:Sialate O-acetylesterase n=1 Tax=Flammeovirga kamogawensis TaxID=373891 RepID=A0ABX8GQZ1_9BACT|nr:sialate O-acetylesterase [Flammeovirga kamogawensis]MBB6463089.1 sialate O-acetylesterase [Flammeovirga kamogawensis]QWG05723.1 sialate O-acetylesterase [Flammeovirga kamogawensis]TRX67552.1 sialate O-acetylesterase [Flammeovirga kamogawensis]
MKAKLLSTGLVLLIATISFGQTKVGSMFTNHMVLQQQANVKIWGVDKPKTKVTVSGSWGEDIITKTSKEGKWQVELPTPKGSFTPYTVTVIGSSEIHLSDVLIGEVWLASGQSNMQMPLKGNKNQPVQGSAQAILEASKPNHIRLFTVKPSYGIKTQDSLEGEWKVATSLSARNFSAVAYFFGKNIAEYINVPVGLINSSRGATQAECWMSEKTLTTVSKKKVPLDNALIPKKDTGLTPSVFYNHMIYPLVGYSIKGVIWYQGESNRMEAAQYTEVLTALINSWRAEWNQGDFPFYQVEIAPFIYKKGGDEAARLRENQFKITTQVKNTGIVSTVDLGDIRYIHPPRKKEVGDRLALLALTNEYGFEGIDAVGPSFKGFSIDNNKVRVSFKDAPNGITSFSKEITGFEVAGEDQVFYPATARIDNKKVAVVVSSDNVAKPVAIRYAFKNFSNANLYGVAGLPVFPFRTDNWEDRKEN